MPISTPLPEQPDTIHVELDDLTPWQETVGILRLVIWDHYFSDHPGAVRDLDMQEAVLCAMSAILSVRDNPLLDGFNVAEHAQEASSVARQVSRLLKEELELIEEMINLDDPAADRRQCANDFAEIVIDLLNVFARNLTDFMRPEEFMQIAVETLLLLSIGLVNDSFGLWHLLVDPPRLHEDVEKVLWDLLEWV